MAFTAVCKNCECLKTGNMWTDLKMNELKTPITAEKISLLNSEICPKCKKETRDNEIPIEYHILQLREEKKQDNRPVAMVFLLTK